MKECIAGLKMKKKIEVAFWQLTERDRSTLSHIQVARGYKSPIALGKKTKYIQNLPLTLTLR